MNCNRLSYNLSSGIRFTSRYQSAELPMAITIEVPSVLQAQCDGVDEIQLNASTVGDALHQLKSQSPDLYAAVCNEHGHLLTHINLFVNSSMLPKAAVNQHPLTDGDVITLFQTIAGG